MREISPFVYSGCSSPATKQCMHTCHNDPKVKPLEATECKKCDKIIAEPKELITIMKKSFIGVVVDEGENDEASFGVVEGCQEE